MQSMNRMGDPGNPCFTSIGSLVFCAPLLSAFHALPAVRACKEQGEIRLKHVCCAQPGTRICMQSMNRMGDPGNPCFTSIGNLVFARPCSLHVTLCLLCGHVRSRPGAPRPGMRSIRRSAAGAAAPFGEACMDG